MLPVDELARDDRFERIKIEDVVFDPRNATSFEQNKGREAGFKPQNADAPDAARATNLDQLLDAGVLHQRLEQRVGQPQVLGEPGAARLSGNQRLQQQLRERIGMKSRLLDGRRRRRWHRRADRGRHAE